MFNLTILDFELRSKHQKIGFYLVFYCMRYFNRHLTYLSLGKMSPSICDRRLTNLEMEEKV